MNNGKRDMTENTWPDPARPGVPLNPQQPGKHWLRSPEGELCLSVWFVTDNPKHSFWEKGPGWSSPPAIARRGWAYLGPCLTPEEVQAKDARIAELEGALRDARAKYIELDDKDAAEAMAKIINRALGHDERD